MCERGGVFSATISPSVPSGWQVYDYIRSTSLAYTLLGTRNSVITRDTTDKRTQSTNSDSPSVTDISPANTPKDAKAIKREAGRLQLELEKQRRALAERLYREQARAVMQKRNQILMQATGTAGNELEWSSISGRFPSLNQCPNHNDLDKGKGSASGPIRQSNTKVSSSMLNAASGRYLEPPDTNPPSNDRWVPRDERLSKVRRGDLDDDHSMASSDAHSTGRMSAMSFATMDSGPGPSRARRPTVYGIS